MAVSARALLKVAAALLLCCATPIIAGPLNLQKIRLKGAQNIKDLRYFQETGLVSARHTAIEMQIENYERSLTQLAEAKQIDRNAALKAVQANYEKFAEEFKAIADIYRDLALRHRNTIHEKSGEKIGEISVREKVVTTIEVAKQDETRALAAYTNRNYNYSAHLYWRSLRHYAKVFSLRKWQPLVQIIEKPKTSKKPLNR